MRPLLTACVAVLLLAPSSPEAIATAGRFELRFADLVSHSSTIVVGEVIALHLVAGEQIVEVRVEEVLKGRLSDDTVFYSVRVSSWDPGVEPTVGERALLLLESGCRFRGTRAFWKALDRLRAGRPFLPLVLGGLGRLPILVREGGSDPVVHLYDVILPPGVLARLPEGMARESPQRLVDVTSLLEAVRRLAESPEPVDPPVCSAPS